MRDRYRTPVIACLLASLWLSPVATAEAQRNREAASSVTPQALAGYVFVKVADTTTLIPGGSGRFVELGIPSVDGGTVAFRADGDGGQKGVYALIGNTLTKVADLNTPVPGRATNFDFFGAVSLPGDVSVASDGSVAFTGQTVGQRGIYTNATGSLSTLADDGAVVPGNPGAHFANFFHISYDAGQVAFTAVSDGFQQGLYLADGVSVSLVADTNTPIPGGVGNFGGFGLSNSSGRPSLSGDDVVFTGHGGLDGSGRNQSGIYGRIGGSLTVIADRNTLIPGTSTLFATFEGPADLRDGQVAFRNIGIYVARDGGIDKVADTSTRFPGTRRRFDDLGEPAIDDGKVAFEARSYFRLEPYIAILRKSGIYTDLPGPLTSVVERSRRARLDGKVVKEAISGTEGLSAGVFAFKVIFTNNTQAIYIARPM
jgi:hypothetical protein